MTLVTRLYDNIRLSCPGVLDQVIDLELFNVVDEFFRTSNAWREVIPVTLVAGTDTYTIQPSGTEILEVPSVVHPSLSVAGALYELGSIALETAPTSADVAAGQLFITATLTPAQTVSASDVESWIPGDLWTEYYQAFLSGTVGRLMGQPAKPYSNPQLGVFHARRFRNFMAEARYEVEAGSLPGAQLWRFPRWA